MIEFLSWTLTQIYILIEFNRKTGNKIYDCCVCMDFCMEWQVEVPTFFTCLWFHLSVKCMERIYSRYLKAFSEHSFIHSFNNTVYFFNQQKNVCHFALGKTFFTWNKFRHYSNTANYEYPLHILLPKLNIVIALHCFTCNCSYVRYCLIFILLIIISKLNLLLFFTILMNIFTLKGKKAQSQ